MSTGQKVVNIDEALVLGERTPPRQMTGYKRKLIPDSPPDTTSRPEDIMKVDVPTPLARQMAFDASAEDRRPRGGKTRRRKTKKGRKTRRRGGDPPNVVVSNPAWNVPKGKSKSVTGKGRKTHRRRK
jgi:hypothetical protein